MEGRGREEERKLRGWKCLHGSSGPWAERAWWMKDKVDLIHTSLFILNHHDHTD